MNDVFLFLYHHVNKYFFRYVIFYYVIDFLLINLLRLVPMRLTEKNSICSKMYYITFAVTFMAFARRPYPECLTFI